MGSSFLPADGAETPPVAPPGWQFVLAFAAVYIIWGSTYLAIKFAIETLPPFLMAGVRFLIAGTVMIGWARWRGAEWPTRAQARGAAVVGLLLLAGANGGLTWAEQFVPTGIASLVIATVPMWVTLLTWVQPGGRRPRGTVLVGVGLGLLGLLLLVGPGQLNVTISGVGVAALLTSALLWSTGTVYGHGAEMPRAPLMASGVQMFSGALALLVVGMAAGEAGQVSLAGLSLRSGLALGYLVVFGSLIGFTSYSWLIRNAAPAQTATYAYVNPIVAVFLGWALAGEALTGRMVVGALVTLAGVAVITMYRGRREGGLAR